MGRKYSQTQQAADDAWSDGDVVRTDWRAREAQFGPHYPPYLPRPGSQPAKIDLAKIK